MLKHLKIENYAIIEKVDISFLTGLNIITGETGAGKSILLGALSILLGDRFDKNALYDEQKKCIIEAEFDIQTLKLNQFFESNDLDDFSGVCLLRREINASGRSRSFINDSPVNLKTIRTLASKLIDIHSQHDILDLKSSAYQLDIIDLEAGNEKHLTQFSSAYDQLKKAQKTLNDLEESKEKGLSELDYLEFVLQEFKEAQLEIDEEDALVEEKHQLDNAENIELNLNSAHESLNGEISSIYLLDKSIDALQELKNFIPEIDQFIERLQSAQIEVKDIAEELEVYKEKFESNPSRLEEVNQRLNLIYALERKHQVKSIQELKGKENNIANQVAQFKNIDQLILKSEKEIVQHKKNIETIALKLRENRKKAIGKIEKSINKLLPEIGMPFALFKVDLKPLNFDSITSKGMDDIQFLMSPDKGNKYGPINKIASGGELSRIMLGIKSIMAKSNNIPSLIFDEIDTGISGDIASKVADLLKSISEKHQIISITHLAQIAAKGEHHLFVQKRMEEGKTVTQVRALDVDERIEEIATMLSGKKPSDTALKNASELLAE